MTELECGPIFIQPLLRHSVLMQALRATAAAAAFNNSRLRTAQDLALISGLKEPQSLLGKRVVILEDGAVSSVRGNAELSLGQLAGQFHGMGCRHHDVVVAVNDQNRLPNEAEGVCRRHPHFVIATTWA
jgi:hypothetical protein